MSKYYKAEDVINTLADQYMFEATMDSPYASSVHLSCGWFGNKEQMKGEYK